MDSSNLISNIPKPKGKGRLSVAEILTGTPITPLQRVNLMSSDDYEDFILEWVDGFLQKFYLKVRRFGGAGDKGRDIVGYIDEQNNIDIYQCKHYESPIAPTTLYPELGKLCYYTFNKSYPIPKNYFIVAPKGVGSSVLDLIANPTSINQQLIDNWDKYCKEKISKKEKISLEEPLLQHVKEFDFSILKDKAPHEIISEHSTTIHYPRRFGGGLKKYREVIPSADEDIQPRELNYTRQLFEVYSEETQETITCVETLKKGSTEFLEHFNEQRNSFYCAESLEVFSRENFADLEPLPFEELKSEAYNLIRSSLLQNRNIASLDRLLNATQEVKHYSFNSNPLSTINEIKAQDKEGLCHHLANEDKVKWIRKK